MDDFISREAANRFVCNWCNTNDRQFCHGCKSNPLGDIPAAEVVEVRHAHWIVKDGCAYCSDCRNNFKKAIMTHSKFCPMCGAKMDGGKDE